MRAILIAALAALLTACAGTAPLQATGAPPARIVGFATLAPLGSFEWRAAAPMTALAKLRHDAARDLRAGRIGAATARDIQSRADAIRALIDGAIKSDKNGDGIGAENDLITATEQLVTAIAILKGKP